MSKLKPSGDRHIVRKALSMEVADQLCARIRRQRLTPNTVLGHRGRTRLGVRRIRTVIREAVGQLRGLGLVVSRQGVGLCVASVDVIDTMSKTLAPMMGDESTWSDLCHMRFVLEVGSLPLAVERADSEKISKCGF